MKAQVGDKLVMEGKHVGQGRRIGEIMEISHADGTPPYRVRWEDGHEGLVFPGSDCHLESSKS
jgi:hypothetical protein